ncbi:MAG: hypothetical protein RLZZ590_355 [Actinomycetota bacterium]|jgi:hypothetical protein
MMTKFEMAIYTVILVCLVGAFAYAAWKRRQRMQEATFEAPLEALEFFGEPIAESKAFYVATTFADNKLERVNAYGLGSRGNGQILVFSEGLLILRTGERPLAIDKTQLTEVTKSTAVIDKAVETDGLLSICWMQDSTELATHLRFVETSSREALIASIESIITREVVK